MNFDHVRVELDDHGKGNIWINGQKLKSTYGFRIAAGAGYITKIMIEIYGAVEYEGSAEISINTHDKEPTAQDAMNHVESFVRLPDEVA